METVPGVRVLVCLHTWMCVSNTNLLDAHAHHCSLVRVRDEATCPPVCPPRRPPIHSLFCTQTVSWAPAPQLARHPTSHGEEQATGRRDPGSASAAHSRCAGASTHPRDSQPGENCSSICRGGLARGSSSGSGHRWGQRQEPGA